MKAYKEEKDSTTQISFMSLFTIQLQIRMLKKVLLGRGKSPMSDSTRIMVVTPHPKNAHAMIKSTTYL